MLVPLHQNARKCHNLLIACNSFEIVKNFKHLRTLGNQNCIHEEVTCKLNA